MEEARKKRKRLISKNKREKHINERKREEAMKAGECN
jgi:hypothetical protein